MHYIISSISYFIPVTILVLFIYLHLLFNLNMFSINYDFTFKFYLGIILSIVTSVYIFSFVEFNHIAIFFGFVLTLFIIKGFKSFNSNSFQFKNLVNNIKIIELIYNLKFHPKDMTTNKINKFLPLIESLSSKNLKNYVYKLINKVKLINNDSKSDSDSESHTESSN